MNRRKLYRTPRLWKVPAALFVEFFRHEREEISWRGKKIGGIKEPISIFEKIVNVEMTF